MEENPKVIMDEDTKWRVELSNKIERLVETMAPEQQPLRLQHIAFDPECRDRGWTAVLYAGSMIGTGKKGVMLVPRRTCKILEALGISYRVLSTEELDAWPNAIDSKTSSKRKNHEKR